MLNKKQLKRFIFTAGIVLLGLASFSQPAEAATQTQNADFEIQPILPSEQVDKSLNYYDVNFKPGSTHVIKMKVQNFTDHKITLKSDLQNGMTQNGGGMKFQAATKGLDASLAVPFTKIASIKKADQVLHLGPQEATTISVTIKMPEEKFSGMIAGGWHFIEYLDKSGNESQSVSSNYAYMVSVNLRGSNYKVYPELKYDSTKPMLSSGHPAMGIKLRNVKPMVLKDVHFKAVLYKEGLFSSKRVYEKSGSSIAPNSSVILPISWNYKTLKPGKYHVDVKVTGQNLWNKLPMTWTFKKSFNVKSEDVKKINQQAIQRPVNKWAYVAATSGLMMLVSAVGLYRVIRIGR